MTKKSNERENQKLEPFSEGYPCWFFVQNDSSPWVRKLEWYLHFQPLRSLKHATPNLSDGLLNLCQSLEYSPPKFKIPDELPLTIACSELLPAQVCVVLPENADFEKWISAIKKIWADYGKPKARIFLPEKISKEKAQSALGSHRDHFDFVEGILH